MDDNADLKRGRAQSAGNWCNTSTKVDYCSYNWRINQFYEYHYQNKQQIYSSWFKSTTNDKYKWALRLQCDPDYKRTKAMLLMSVKDDQFCKDMLVKCKISVINIKGEDTNIQVEQSHYQELTKCETLHTTSPPFYYIKTFTDFLNEADILDKEKFILENDTITIRCEVCFIANKSDTSTITSDKFTVDQVDNGGLLEDLEHLLGNDEFSDFTVSINGKKYPVHKTILAARSKVFASMLKHEMKETNLNLVEITDMDEKVFEEMLRYMYTGKSPNLGDMAGDLLSAAEKYDLEHLKTMCELSLIMKLSINSVVDSLMLADTFHADLLKQQSIQFIKLHIKAVKKTENWAKIEQSGLLNEVFNAFFP